MSTFSEPCDSPSNIYEEVLNDETTYDLSCKQLLVVPEINNKLISVLYLHDNKITNLPEDFFLMFPNLMWLDLRDNELTDIPKSIQNHSALTHLLLQNNQLKSLPNELGTVNLKVLQLNGNPLTYPPQDVIKSGVKKILDFLHEKYIEQMCSQSVSENASENASAIDHYTDIIRDVVSYNSVLDGEKLKKPKTLSIHFSGKDIEESDDDSYIKIKGKCPKLAKSRHQIPTYCQSSKYVEPPIADSRETMNQKIRQSYIKDLTIKKHKELLETRDKILQGRKNFELLKNWRKNYVNKQKFSNSSYKMDSQHFPYDTNPEYMTLLTREDLEKDLPDKYKKKLIKKCKPTVPRKNNNDVHLAMKIKELFENLDAIDLTREGLTPRTEKKMLLSEIQKITEIKQKLSELSSSNGRSVVVD